MSEETFVDRAALHACKAQVQEIVRVTSRDDLVHAAFMVGLIVGQADHWVGHNAPNTAAERISEAERYLDRVRLAAAEKGIWL
jgi:hypothetical protein